MNPRKRLFALIMSLAMVFSYMPSMAFAAAESNDEGEPVAVEEEMTDATEAADAASTDDDGTEETVQQTISVSPLVIEAKPAEETEDPDDLLMGYINKQVQGKQKSGLRKAARSTAGSKLTGNNAAIYDRLVPQLEEVASGDRSDAAISVDIRDFNDAYQEEFTAGDLGVDAIVADDEITTEATDAFYELFGYDPDAIINALLADMPYEMYWYDKTQACVTTGLAFGATCYDTDEWVLTFGDPTITFWFSGSVAEGYRGESSTVDLGDGDILTVYEVIKTDAVDAAISNADTILAENESASDVDKLYAYKDAICDMVTYNDAAAENDDTPYGDPWQMIWALDGDPSTNVVCEGYSKALQFLCDKTEFADSRIECISVNGDMDGGTGAGKHMWNILHMDDNRNYVADITNSDEGTIGDGGELFLKGVTSFEENGYSFDFDGNDEADISYIYDEDTQNTYSEEQLDVSGADYSGAVDEWWSINRADTNTYVSADNEDETVYLEVLLNTQDVDTENTLTANWYAGHGEVASDEPVYTASKSYPGDDLYGFDCNAPLRDSEGDIFDIYRCTIVETDSNGVVVKEESIDINVTVGSDDPGDLSWYVNSIDDIHWEEGADTVDLEATVDVSSYEEAGVEPPEFTYTWYNNDDVVVGNERVCTVPAEYSYYRCEVEDQDGNRDTSYCTVLPPVKPAAKIGFVLADGSDHYELYENTGGYNNTYWVDDVEYTYYYYHLPRFTDGDTLILYAAEEDASGIEYIYDGNDSFVNVNDDKDVIYEYELICNTDQEFDNQWVVDQPEGASYEFTIGYGDVTASIPVKIIRPPFDSIEFTRDGKKNKIELINGYDTYEENAYDDDENYIGTFERYYWSFEKGDIITLKSTEGDKSYKFIGYGDEGGYIFENTEEPNDKLDPYAFSLSDEQSYDNPWSMGSSNTATITYLGVPVEISVDIIANPISNIRYESADGSDTIKLIEEYLGYWDDVYDENDEPVVDDQGNPVKYFRYRQPNFELDDKLYITKNDVINTYKYIGEQYLGEEQEYFEGFVNINDENDRISEWDLDWTGNQSETNPWLKDKPEGAKYYFDVKCLGVSFRVPVVIIENPVSEVHFIREGYDEDHPIELMEAVDGVNSDGGDGEWFEYQLRFKAGDILRILTPASEVIEYVAKSYSSYDEDVENFESESGDVIEPYDDIWIDSDQSPDTEWKPDGQVHTLTLNYMGRQRDVYVKVKENPVKAFSFVRPGVEEGQPIELLENYDGYADSDGDYRYEITFRAGDEVYVTYAGDPDPVTVKYVAECYGNGEMDCFKAEGDVPEGAAKTIQPQQLRGDRSSTYIYKDEDGNYEVATIRLAYQGRYCDIPVTVVKSPIESMFFEREGAEGSIELIENIDGYNTHYLSEDIYMFMYEVIFRAGDKLTIKYPDSETPVTYVYGENDEGLRGFYASGSVPPGAPEYIGDHEIKQETDQSLDNDWELGSSHTITLRYLGQTQTLDVTIAENPVKSISFTRAGLEAGSPVELTEGVNISNWTDDDGHEHFDYWFECIDGDELTVTNSDGSTVVYVYSEDKARFVNSEDPADIAENIWFSADGTDWQVGEEHRFIVEYNGRECYVPAVVVAQHDDEIIHVEAKDADCTSSGNYEYWTRNGKYYTDAECTQETSLEDVMINALGHSWGTASYIWADDHTKCTASHTCSRCSEAETEEGNVTVVKVKDATCDTGSVVKYQADFSGEGFTTQTTEEFTLDDATGHNYQFVDFTWTGNDSDGYTAATANFVCSEDGSHKESIPAQITTETVPPTSSNDGKTTYYAAVSAADSPDGSAHGDSKIVVIPATGGDDPEAVAAAREALQAAYEDARYTAASGTATYTEESLANLNAAINSAKSVLDNADATLSELNAARKELADAKAALEPLHEQDPVEDLLDQAENAASTAGDEAVAAETASATSTDDTAAKAAERDAQEAVDLANAAEAAAQDAYDAALAAAEADPADADAQANLNVAEKNLATAKKIKAAANNVLATAKKAAANVAANKAAAAQAAAESAGTSAQAEAYRKQAEAAAAEAAQKAGEANAAAAEASNAVDELGKMTSDDPDVQEAINKAKEEADETAEAAIKRAEDAGKASGKANDSKNKAGAAVTNKKNSEAAASAKAAEEAKAKADAEAKAAAEAARQGKLNTKLPKLTISKPKAAKKAITVKWKKLTKKNQKKVQKIEIWICPNKKFAASDTIIKTASKKKASLKVKKLKAKKKYYVKVRTIKTINGVKNVSKWSKVKSIKTK